MLKPDEFAEWAKNNIKPGNADDLKEKLENVQLDRRTLFGAVAASLAVGGGSNYAVTPMTPELWHNFSFEPGVSC